MSADAPSEAPPSPPTDFVAPSEATEHSRAINCPHPRFTPNSVYARCRSASPQRVDSPPLHRTATEHSIARSRVVDPSIRLQKSKRPIAVRIKEHHDRTPDVGIGILISIPNYKDEKSPGMIEYYGEYLGHGKSKTASELRCPGALFHGKVLKVAKADDNEPEIFMEAAQLGLTPSILYNCVGVDADRGRRFHCWITDRTIPLDDFCREYDAIKRRCSLANANTQKH